MDTHQTPENAIKNCAGPCLLPRGDSCRVLPFRPACASIIQNRRSSSLLLRRPDEHNHSSKGHLWGKGFPLLSVLKGQPSKCCPRTCRLEKDTDVDDGHEEVGDDADAVSLPFFGLCGCPVESVQDVLTKGGEEPISHLTVGGGRESQRQYSLILIN